ncbi:MAG: hypothetical protein H6623_08790 [Bdellovibrionaceae bacterium]|nr:hypothetical protein [Pseudobdellovibrionaceae bacterium]
MKKPSFLKNNNKGFAVLEAVVVLFVFLVIFWYSMGFFGVVHTGILQSIASRNYAFETFRHRANLWYFRTNTPGRGLKYHGFANRLHGTNSDAVPKGGSNAQVATERRVAMFKGDIQDTGRSTSEHENAGAKVQPGVRNTQVSLDPVWIKVQYGICLTVACGD